MAQRRRVLLVWSAEPPEMAHVLRDIDKRFPGAEISLFVSRFRDRIVGDSRFVRRYVHPMPTRSFRFLGLGADRRAELRDSRFDEAVLPFGDPHGHYYVNYKLLLLMIRARARVFYHHEGGFRTIGRLPLVLDMLSSVARRAFLAAARQVDVLLFLPLMVAARVVSRVRRGRGAAPPAPGTPATVCHFITSLGLGGAQRQLLLSAELLSKEGFRTSTVAWLMSDDFYGPAFADRGLDVTVFRRTGGFFTVATLRLYRRLRQTRPDVLHNWLFLANMVGSTAGALAGVPCVLSSVRNMNLWKRTWYRQWWFHAGDFLAARLCDRVLGNAEAVSADTRQWLRLPEDHVVTITNAVLPEWVTAITPEQARDKRREAGLSDTDRVVMICGRLSIEKDHRTFFKSLKALADTMPDVRGLVIGGGELEEELVSFAMDAGIADRVVFLGSRKDVHEWMQAADVVLQASIIEGMPNAIIEALVLKRPVVATDAGGTREIVIHRETGLLVPVGDVHAMAAALKEILADADLARRLGEKGREHVLAHCSADRMMTRLKAIYRDSHTRGPAGSRKGE